MILRIEQLLGAADLARIDSLLDKASWRDGSAGAGSTARRVKRNTELDRQKTPGAQEIETTVHRALTNCRALQDFAFPKRYSRPMISRYENGMEYGRHVDNPLLANPAGAMRTDVSVTVFLADPETYDGGALMIDPGTGEVPIKPARGDAVAYTTGTPHRVEATTRGARLAAVCWIESMVADPYQRSILSRLHGVQHRLAETAPEDPTTFQYLEAYYDLVRLWTRP